MELNNEFVSYPILNMNPNRYKYRNHKTMFKNKINCKKFYELYDNNDDNDTNDTNDTNDSNKDLYLDFTRHHYQKYDFLSKLDKISLEYKTFIDLVSNSNSNSNNEFLCIKVGNDYLKREYKINETLQQLNIPIFMKFYCILECKNNLCIDNHTKFLDVKRYVNQNYNEIYASRFPDEIDVPVNILVMPYASYGEFGLHAWNKEDFHILKNCLKHLVMSLLYASYKLDFITSYGYHENGGIHEGNLLLCKTELKSVSYGEFGYLEIIDGYIPMINDYHYGGFIDYTIVDKTIQVNNHDWMVYLDIRTIIMFVGLRSESKLPMVYNANCLQLIENLYNFTDCSQGITITPISKEICNMICNEIDTFEYDN